ncbi:MAG: NAD-dependent malic enzyme [Planctomycetota bacterium]
MPWVADAVPTGMALLRDPHLNKGTAFSEAERELLGLRGLLPPHVFSEAQQEERVLAQIRRGATDLDKYMALSALQERNETLFFRILYRHLEEMMPIVYTPTVGEACQRFGHIYQRPRGLFVSIEDRGRVESVLRNWPVRDVRVIVVTDGARILGLGDLGADGMGIPVGKLALYTACAGIDPRTSLPITLDVGTNNETLLADPMYIGLRRHRADGAEYDDFVEEFVQAVQTVFPKVLLQFEDFSNNHAFDLLKRYQDRLCCFNDDIQGTASVALAGVLASLRASGMSLRDHRFLFLGAGEAGIGIADLIVSELVDGGMDAAEARRLCWFCDSQGLVVKSRTHLAHHKLPYAHDHAWTADLLEAVKTLRPTALIGVSGQAQSFTGPVVTAMAEINERPMVFALSNPTSKAECTARQAYTWSNGRAIFASGSPFPAVELDGRTFVPGQGNNSYIFPGVGLGVVASGASRVTEEMFRAAARTLARETTPAELESGCLYPALTRIREVSARIACAVAEIAYERGLATVARPESMLPFVMAKQYQPEYRRHA